jgi:hypothetical protein
MTPHLTAEIREVTASAQAPEHDPYVGTVVTYPAVASWWFGWNDLAVAQPTVPAGTAVRPAVLNLFSTARPTPTLADSLRRAPRTRRSAQPLRAEETRAADADEENPATREVSTRRELLLKRDGEGLSPEERARLQLATSRLRRLLPRVTTDDFERLVDAAQVVENLSSRVAALKEKLGRSR